MVRGGTLGVGRMAGLSPLASPVLAGTGAWPPWVLAGLGVGAALVGIVATYGAMGLARRVGLVDHPGRLKVQDHPVPYLGGLGVAAALALGLGLWAGAGSGRGTALVLLAPLALALGLGVTDDARGLTPWVRLAGEVATGLLVAWALPVRLPAAVPAALSSVLGPAAAVVAVVVLVNGCNMVDGLDGLAGGVGTVSAVGLAVILGASGAGGLGGGPVLAVALGGGLVGFLVWNHPPARVYLGDGGAYLVGTVLAVLLVLCWHGGMTWSSSLGALAAVAYPAAELGFAMVRRYRAGASLTSGDRGHVYDRMTSWGWSPPLASAACIAVQVALAGAGLGAMGLPTAGAAALVGGAGVALVLAATWSGLLAPTEGARSRPG